MSGATFGKCTNILSTLNRLFAENDGIKALLPLFSDSHAVCRHFAAECVTSVSCDGEPA